MYIDCHAHVFFRPIPKEAIDKDIEGEIPTPTIDFINRMISNAKKKGVSRIVGVISNPNDFSRYKEQLEFGDIINIIGISRNNLMEDQSYLISLLKNEIEANIPNGIGEIGLDTYDFDKFNDQEKNKFKIKQQELFAKQIRIAKEFDIPIVVHAGYGTDKSIVNILKQEHANDVGGQIHGYMSKEDLVSELLDQGFYFSFGYIHSREEELKRILKITPPEKMLIETDSPYHLMESPKRFILPEDVIQITKEIAKFKEIDPQDLANIVVKNAKTLFNFS
ncbi:MAG: TatD family hydrolase [Candidatus Thorarchaeota archaeon]